jgi:hypothetical protein
MTEREHQQDAEPQVEDLDVPESEGEDVKGGAFDAFHKIDGGGIKGLKIDSVGSKISPGQFGLK